MTSLPTEQVGSILYLPYQQYDTVESNQNTEQKSGMTIVAYQQYDTIESNYETNQNGSRIYLSYQEYETIERTPAQDDYGQLLKIVVNIMRFKFAGKAYMFDGSKFTEIGSPYKVVFPTLVSKEDKIYTVGGQKEDGTILGDVYGYNQDIYVATADRDYSVYVIAGDTPVYLIDQNKNVVQKIEKLMALPLLSGWGLISRSPFVLIISKLG